MAVITIDGKRYTVESGKNLLEVCLSEGLNLPYFCWHPAMGSVGACRQCAAKQFANEEDKRGRLVTACMTEVQDGQLFSIEEHQAKQFRASVIESLMTNHPHDCPVCEEGGECHLQDMTEMSGHTSRRYRGKKRTHNNQYLGPLINHEMNRCISCYRCVRFYNDYAGGRDLAAMASHNHVYFGREKDGVLESEFAGNLVEVCPTGVFTDKPFSQHYSRKWDLQTAPSICTHCAVGCNTTPGARYGTIRRVVNRYHSKINGYFLCDRGRFGYGYNHQTQRLLQSKTSDGTDDSAQGSSTDSVNKLVQATKASNTLLVGVGSGRTSLENNFVLREYVGSEHFYSGVTLADYESHKLLVQQLMAGSLDIADSEQIEQADAIILLGEDIAETAPRIALAMRQAVRNKGIDESKTQANIHSWQDAAVRRYSADTKTPLLIATLTTTRLDDIATDCFHAAPELIAQMGFYIADHLVANTSEVTLHEGQRRWADTAIQTIKQAKRPLIISGSGYQQLDLTRSSMAVYGAVKQQQKNALYYYAVSETNSLGLALLSTSTQPHTTNNRAGKSYALQDLMGALKTAGQDKLRRVLIVLENDLYRAMDASNVNELLNEVDELIVLDHNQTETTNKADTTLAVSTVLESQGTLINNQARAQRFYSVMPPADGLQTSWRYLCDAAKELEKNHSQASSSKWTTLSALHYCDDISHAIAKVVPALAKVVELNTVDKHALARQSHRYSGRTAMAANIAVAEKRQAQDPDSPFTYSMEGAASHGALENSVWAPGWNSNQAIHKYHQHVTDTVLKEDILQEESGVCLFPFNPGAAPVHFQTPADNYQPESSSIQVYPLQHVFGSDELSAKAEAITSLAPPACILMNPIDANILQVKEWDTVLCSMPHQSQQLYVRLDSDVPKGIAGILQTGLGCLSSHWPVAVTLVKDKNALPKPVSMIATDGEHNNVC